MRTRREKIPKALQLVGEISALGESEPFRKPVVITFLIRQLGESDAQRLAVGMSYSSREARREAIRQNLPRILGGRILLTAL